jgi:hypothetical protein
LGCARHHQLILPCSSNSEAGETQLWTLNWIKSDRDTFSEVKAGVLSDSRFRTRAKRRSPLTGAPKFNLKREQWISYVKTNYRERSFMQVLFSRNKIRRPELFNCKTCNKHFTSYCWLGSFPYSLEWEPNKTRCSFWSCWILRNVSPSSRAEIE